MTARQRFALQAAGVALLVVASGVAFAAYLKPDMLVEFVTFLCS